MKLKKEFISYNADGEQLLVPVGNTKFQGLVKANPSAAFIFECLKESTSEKAIVRKMQAKYDDPDGNIPADVHRILIELVKIGALEK